MENNYNTDSAGSKIKEFFMNRAVIITIATLLLAVSVIVAITVTANRSRKPAEVETGTETATAAVAATEDDKQVMKGDETQANYNAGETDNQVQKPQEDEPLTMKLPTSGKLMKGHDASIQVYSNTMGDYRVHLGIDVSTAENGPIYAAADGKVSKIWTDPLMGQCVAIDHGDNVLSVYKNLSSVLASGIAEGKTVTVGQKLGTIGDSAILEMAEEPHLHFEVTVNGVEVNPLSYFSEDDVNALTAADADQAFESTAVGK